MTRAFSFLAQARMIDGKAVGRREASDDEIRSFKALYGARPEICLVLYRKLREVDCRPTIEHFLWAMAFLKLYHSEDDFAKRFHVTRKTFREHVWRIVRKIASLSGRVVSKLWYLN